MKKRILTSLLPLTVLIAAGCSNPKSQTMTAANKDKVLAAVAKSKMTEEERTLLGIYLMRAEMSKTMPGLTGGPVSWEGKTVGQVIEEQRKFQADAKAREAQAEQLAAQAKAKEEMMSAELRKVINLSVYSVKVESADGYGFTKNLNIKCAYENSGAKNIRAFQGVIIFRDLFGAVISKIRLKISHPIAAGAKDTWEGGHHYNQFDDEDRKLANTELKDIKIEWQPVTVIFEDGTKIGEEIREE